MEARRIQIGGEDYLQAVRPEVPVLPAIARPEEPGRVSQEELDRRAEAWKTAYREEEKRQLLAPLNARIDELEARLAALEAK